VLILLVSATAAARKTVTSPAKEPARPDLQRVLDSVIHGPKRIAPGATAFVSGPHGTWLGSAGVADVKTGEKMRPDARMRLESTSKWWLGAVILQLAQQGKLTLNDTVQHWLPGLLPFGKRITIRHLLTDTSGMIDDNDLLESPQAFGRYLARVKDPKLRAQIMAIVARGNTNPALEVSPIWLIRIVAWQPLLFKPGSRYHHCNTGWDIAGMIAARAAGKPLPVVYRERLFRPLGLTHTAWDPQGPIAGPHASGYWVAAEGKLTDKTAQHQLKGADGAIVSNAEDTATFFTALMRGKLINRAQLDTLQREKLVDGGGGDSGCAGHDHLSSGAGDAYKSNALVKDDGSRVAVLLLNGRTEDLHGFDTAANAVWRLYCAA
jgi:D-alanyl-D-alanine carboxypeptidase